MDFKSLGLHDDLIENLNRLGFTEPTPIQAEAIPVVLQKKDVAGLAQTGTGKTAAFLLPTIHRILCSISEPEGTEAFDDWGVQNFCLILVPTRELAEQVNKNIEDLNCNGKIKSAVIIGGKEYDEQIKKIAEGVDFLVATPGRLIDLYKEKKVDLNLVASVIFDEADRMFDMGFKDDMIYLLQRVPSHRQLLMFSATLNFDVLNVAYEFGSEPVEINIDRDQARAENVDDEIFHVGQDEKPKYLLSLLKKINPSQGIIFSNFKRNIPKLEKFLLENNYKTQGISSSLNQNQRQRVMNKFKGGEVQILVATDVAARGLDIKGVDLVINFELPDDPENYIHRIGRTGRAGAKGLAYSLVSDRDVMALGRIEDYVGNKMTVGWLEDTDMVQDFKPFPYNYDVENSFSRIQGRNRDDKLQDAKTSRRSKSRDGQSSSRRDFKKPGAEASHAPRAGGRSTKFKKPGSGHNASYANKSGVAPHSEAKASEGRGNKGNKNFNKSPRSANQSHSGQTKNRYENFKTRKRGISSTASAPSSASKGILSKFKKWLGL